MAKVVWHVTMSLDGFIAGPGDAMDWVFEYTEPNPVVDEVIRTTGAMLGGRRTYEVGVRDDQEAYEGSWTGPQFILTHEPPEAPTDPAISFPSGDVRGAVALALDAANGQNVVVTGADVAQQCLDAGLVDEIVIHLAPVLLGDGVRLFGRRDTGRIDLERTSVSHAGQLTNLRFGVKK